VLTEIFPCFPQTLQVHVRVVQGPPFSFNFQFINHRPDDGGSKHLRISVNFKGLHEAASRTSQTTGLAFYLDTKSREQVGLASPAASRKQDRVQTNC
jgi:hypothetical protein